MPTNNEVAHAWAHNLDKHYKTSNGNMFRAHGSGYGSPKEDYDTIYSYGHHFPIARHVELPNGKKVVFLTTRGYSITTSQHISTVLGACRHLEIIRVDNVCADSKGQHKSNYECMKKEREKLLKSAARRRSTYVCQSDLGEAETLRKRMNEYTQTFKLGYRQIKESLGENDLDAIKEQIKKEAAKKRLENKRKEVKKMADIIHWIAGESNYMPHVNRTFVRVKGNEVQTSKHARVPLEDALKLFKLARKCQERKTEFIPDQEIKIGYYPLTKISANGTLKVSCHTIDMEAQLMAAKAAGISY